MFLIIKEFVTKLKSSKQYTLSIVKDTKWQKNKNLKSLKAWYQKEKYIHIVIQL